LHYYFQKMGNSKKRFLLAAFCLLLFPFSLFSQQTLIDIDENAQNRIMALPVQPCDYSSNINLNTLPVIKNNKQIPAFELYENQWDTLFIRSKKIEIPFFNNQLKIILVQENNNPFAFPIAGTVSTGYVKSKGRQHTGVDFSVKKQEPVVACFDGVVRIAKKFSGYGNTVVVRHYNGLETVYALLDNVCVVTGQTVKAGDILGYAGVTSANKKNALHFETRFLNEFFNPEKMINFSDRKLQDNILILIPNDFISVPVVSANQSAQQDNLKSQENLKSNENTSQKLLLETPKSMPVFHTVEKGETIFRICTKYNITEQQLRSLNNIKGDHIELGQKLRIK